MSKVDLNTVAGGKLQEQFDTAFKKVVDNLKDPNTPFKVKREITIKISLTQPEERDKTCADIAVTCKMAPIRSLQTNFAIEKDLRNGDIFVQEYGENVTVKKTKIKDDAPEQVIDGNVVNTDTGEIIDYRKKA